MSSYLKAICSRQPVRYTTTDGLKGAAVMIINSVVMLSIGIVCNRNGWHQTGEFFKGLSFPLSMLLMSHVMFMKGQSATAKGVITGGTLVFLVVISAVATWL